MKPPHFLSHERAESILFEKGLGGVYAEALEVVLATRVDLAPQKGANMPRVIWEHVLKNLADRGWEIAVSIFPASAPAMFQRGNYRLDAIKRMGTGSALGLICHFGSAEFLVRQLILISEAVRRGIADCAVLALMTRDFKAHVPGRPSCYEQARRLLRVYGQSGFHAIPMILWGLTPDSMQSELADVRAGLRAGLQ